MGYVYHMTNNNVFIWICSDYVSISTPIVLLIYLTNIIMASRLLILLYINIIILLCYYINVANH